MDINEININIQHLQKQIDMIDSDYKFYINFILVIIGLIAASAYSYIKNKTDEAITKIISKKFDMLVLSNNDYDIDFGERWIIKEDLVDNTLSFPVTDNKFYLSQSTTNRIFIEPLRGNNVLNYKAEIKNGKMIVKFKNFDPDKDEGIRWKVVYLSPESKNMIYSNISLK